jgi:hypothetical protein
LDLLWGVSLSPRPSIFGKLPIAKSPQSLRKANFPDNQIRGSYSFQEINSAFQIPVADLAAAFGIDASEAESFQVKSLEAIYSPLSDEKEVGTASVRLFAALYKGLPIALEDDIYLPEAAADILKVKASLTPEQLRFIETHTVQMPNLAEELSVAGTDSEPSTARLITGKTTFQELLSWGLEKEKIERILQENMPDSDMVIKDYAAEKGLEFSVLKGSLQEEADKI